MMRRVVVAVLILCSTACDSLVTKPLNYTAVDVRAERRDGTPITGVPLILYTGQRPMGYDTTNAAGHALFERVPAGPAYGVLAEAPAGYAFPETLLGGPPTNAIGGLVLRTDSTPKLRFQFLRIGPGTVTASVVDQAAKPFAGVHVDLYSPEGALLRGKTSADGRVTFGAVPYGLYGVTTPRPLAYRDLDEPATLWQDGLVVEEGTTATATLTLKLCRGTIDLTVADPTRGGAPGVQTYLYTPTETVDSARTGSDGRVHYVSPLCGDYGVRVVPNNDWRVAPGRGSQFADGLIVHRGSALTVSLSAQYNSCRGAIRVTVVDETGAAVPGATLGLYSSDVQSNASNVATSGTYTFGNLGCGLDRGVSIAAPAGWVAAPGRGGSYVDGLVVTNGTTLDVKFTLTRLAP